MSIKRRPFFGLCATSIFALTAISPAAAQVDPSAGDEQSAPSEADSPALEEIIVTAERREVNLQDTPISIVAISGEAIAETGSQDIQDLATFVPNLSVGSSALGPTMPGFAIRGVGQANTRLHQEAGVALYVDDIYYPRSIGSLFQVVDLERLEVLRGPQGTLFGRNAVGGAIRYVTKKPTRELEGRLSSTVGSFGRFDVEGMLNLPITDSLRVRLQAARITDEGFIDRYDWNRATNTIVKTSKRAASKDDTLFRGSLRFEPTSDLTIDLTASHMRAEGIPPPALVRAIAPTTGNAALSQRAFRPIQVYLTRVLNRPALGVNDPLIVSPTFYSDIDRCITDDPTIRVVSLPTYDLTRSCDTRVDIKVNIFQGTIAYDLTDNFKLKSITGYQTLDSESTIDLFGLDQPAGQNEQGTAFSQELQALYSSDRLQVTTGLFYFRQRAQEQTFQRRLATPFSPVSPFPVEIAGEDTDFDQVAKSWAVYGEATYSLTPALHLTAGLRYTDDRKTASVSATNVQANRVFTNSLHYTSIDYRAVLRYEFSPDVSVYASTSSGYKAGGFNNRLVAFVPYNPPPAPPKVNPQPVARYEPEKITNYEVGLRSDLLNRRVRFNATGYFMIYKDIIQDYIDFSGTAGAQVFSVNAADVEIKGLETDVTVAVTRGLTLTGSLALNDVKFTRIDIGSPALDPATCPGVNPVNPTQCEPMRYARSPKLSYSLGANYNTQLTDTIGLSLNANYGFTGRQQSQYSAASSIFLPSYAVLNLRAQVDFDDKVSIAAFVTNALKEKYLSGGGFGADNNGNVLIDVPGRPREFGVTGTVRF